MCLLELSLQYEVLIPSSIHQEEVEAQAATLFAGLEDVWPSSDCEMEFKEFWCLLLFGVCDGQSRLPSFEVCSSLQTRTCFDLIQFASTAPEFSTIILNCNNFRLGRLPPCTQCFRVLFCLYVILSCTCKQEIKAERQILTCHAVMASSMTRVHCCASRSVGSGVLFLRMYTLPILFC